MANTPSFLVGGHAEGNGFATLLENQTKPVAGQLRVDDADGMSNPNYQIFGAAKNGTATIDTDGNWTYVPHPDFNGKDKFLVVVTDDEGFRSTHYVILDVQGTGEHNGIDAFDDAANVVIGSTTVIDVLANDTFIAATAVTQINGQNITEGESVKVTDATGNVAGTVTLVDGKLLFSAGIKAGQVSFDYTATNSYGVSEKATVVVDVEGRTAPAYVTGGNKGVVYAGDAESATVTGKLTVGDINGIDNPDFQIFAQGKEGLGFATIDAETGVWTYTAPAGSKEAFYVKVTDNLGTTSTVVVHAEVAAGEAPIAKAFAIDEFLGEDAATEVEAAPAEPVVATAAYVAPLEDTTLYVG